MMTVKRYKEILGKSAQEYSDDEIKHELSALEGLAQAFVEDIANGKSIWVELTRKLKKNGTLNELRNPAV